MLILYKDFASTQNVLRRHMRKMKLQDVKNNPEILGKLRWDLTPQTGNISSFEVNSQEDVDHLKALLAGKAGYYFYVDVWNCQARLALMHNLPDGGGKSEIITDFHSALLEKAVEAAGGMINMSGWYPLSRALERMVKKRLGIADR